jgi:GR25 family glycosyltransferase involved in LPS biosynthesis
MDKSVYIETPYRPRSMEELTEVWCWDLLNPPETIPSIQTLFSCPIRRVPFFWSPTYTEHATKGARAFSFAPEPHWAVHIAEKNTNESSAVIPLVAIRAAQAAQTAQSSLCPHQITYLVHNLDPIKENRFLKENILGPIDVSTLPVTLAPKEAFHRWVETANHVFFSHSRFTPLRLSLLSLVWMGVPLFHNSTVLRDLHPTLQEGYYPGNEITEWQNVLKKFLENPVMWWNRQEERREVIRQRFGIQTHLAEWKDILSSMVSPVPASPIPVSPVSTPPILHISFSDMWPGFNPHTNFLLDTLRHFYPSTVFHGELYSVNSGPTDLLIVGPYGQEWHTSATPVPKIFFSAENWPLPVDSNLFSLCLVSAPNREDPTHVRLPTWMTFIDWFSGSETLPPQTTDNPIRLPLYFATHSHPIPFQKRTEFCAFVVSNPTQPFRNEAFQALHQYKPVNSGGSLYNNIGGPLSLLYPGGGAGDLSKHEFFTRHRFTLSAENTQQEGYITEKVLHAKMAGAVPLYWGDRNTDEDFAPHSIVNLSHLTRPEDIVDIVKRLEARPDFCERIAATPILNKEKTEKAIELLRGVCSRVMGLVSSTPPVFTPPVPSPVSPPSLFRDIYVINLDRRKDRWDNLLQAEPYLATKATRISAVDGKALTLTQPLYELFQHNHFEWKKGVIGCNLSHLMAWRKVHTAPVTDNPYTLILEDDVRFSSDWRDRWEQARPHIPADADLLYLGGVLPPNQPVLPHALEAINTHWARIKPNTFFSPVPAPHFHFCAYSYVLTPSGAKKLVDHMIHSKEKYYTISDHMLGSPVVGLIKYVMTPLIAHCFQESDVAYQTSQFNELQRTDTFDSDLWNNTDRFYPERDLPSSCPLSPLASTSLTSSPSLTIYTFGEPSDIYEHGWLQDLFQTSIVFTPRPILEDAPEDAWYLVQRPHGPQWSEWFHALEEKGLSYRILHLSDEFGTDPITDYTRPHCRTVVRNYPRPDLPDVPHLHVIPLGYHRKPLSEATCGKPLSEATCESFSTRPLLWSFHGTDWFGRKEELAPLESLKPNECRLQPSWNHPTGSTKSEYLQSLMKRKFCPVLRGNNVETFRFYEALESGTLPVTTITDRVFLDRVEKELGLSTLYPWTEPERAMKDEKQDYDKIQKEVSQRWVQWKGRLQAEMAIYLTA